MANGPWFSIQLFVSVACGVVFIIYCMLSLCRPSTVGSGSPCWQWLPLSAVAAPVGSGSPWWQWLPCWQWVPLSAVAAPVGSGSPCWLWLWLPLLAVAPPVGSGSSSAVWSKVWPASSLGGRHPLAVHHARKVRKNIWHLSAAQQTTGKFIAFLSSEFYTKIDLNALL